MIPSKHQFVDRDQQVWSFVLHVGNIRRAKQLLGVDLLDYQQPAWLERLALDPGMVVDLCGLLTTPTPAERGLDEETMAAKFDGQVVADAMEALREAWIAFSPAKVQPVLRALAEKTGQAQTMAGAALIADLASPETTQEIEDEIQRRLSMARHARQTARARESAREPEKQTE